MAELTSVRQKSEGFVKGLFVAIVAGLVVWWTINTFGPSILRSTAEYMYERGIEYDTGKGVEQDHNEARAWYQRASDAGNSKAMTMLGKDYFIGQGGSEDRWQARYWFQKAADAGDNEAMAYIGMLYDEDRDFDQARRWYQKAADGGISAANVQFGHSLLQR